MLLSVIVCLLLNFGFSKTESYEFAETHPFLLNPTDESFKNNIRFSTMNSSLRKTSRDDFGVDAYCVLVTEIINDTVFVIQIKSLYTKDVRTSNSKNLKDICQKFETEYNNFINDLRTNKYFKHTCPIVPGFYYVQSFKYDGPTIPESLWNKLTNTIEDLMKRSLELQCNDYLSSKNVLI